MLAVLVLLVLSQCSGNGDGDAMRQWCERHGDAYVCQ
jgi:hypothetical protein